MNTGWWEIDIHGYYSLVKIAFAPICACKNKWRILCHNASISCLRDVTDQLWWRHNAKSEKTVFDDNCDMSDGWLIVFRKIVCIKDIKLRVRNKIIHSLPWITIFGSLVMRFSYDFHLWLRHSWISLANRLTRDPKIVIHGNSCIILISPLLRHLRYCSLALSHRDIVPVMDALVWFIDSYIPTCVNGMRCNLVAECLMVGRYWLCGWLKWEVWIGCMERKLIQNWS